MDIGSLQLAIFLITICITQSFDTGKPCEVSRYKAVFSSGLIPSCNPEGLYEPVQCYKEECWCAIKESGEEIPNTRVKAPAIPNCDYPAIAETQIDLLKPIAKNKVKGVSLNVDGFQGQPAYTFQSSRSLYVQAKDYIPPSLWPDFSILATVKPMSLDGGFLFAIVDNLESVIQFGLSVSKADNEYTQHIDLWYSENPHEKGSTKIARFTVPVMVGRWSRFAIGVNGTNIRLHAYCQLNYAAEEYKRSLSRLEFLEDSYLLIGHGGEIFSEAFIGDIQELKITNNPFDADNQCQFKDDAKKQEDGLELEYGSGAQIPGHHNGQIEPDSEDGDEGSGTDDKPVSGHSKQSEPPETDGDGDHGNPETNLEIDLGPATSAILFKTTPFKPSFTEIVKEEVEEVVTAGRQGGDGITRKYATDSPPPASLSPETRPQKKEETDLIGHTGQSYKGEKGDRGLPGMPGAHGINGIPGIQGEIGPQGLRGEKGEKGDTGVGEPGMPGEPGISIMGEPGEKGEKGDQGSKGDSIKGEKGEQGKSFVAEFEELALQDGAVELLFSKVPQLKGPKGEPGNCSSAAIIEREGTPGPEGPQGQPGLPGQQGATGERGLTGDKGDIGRKGDIGLPGSKGEKGTQGLQGPPGPPGPSVEAHASFLPGEPGEPGSPGEKGEKGDQGVRGESGERGLPGKDGSPGSNGPPGAPGLPGAPGAHGLAGVNGTKGEKGEPGIGLPGPPGPPGPSSVGSGKPFFGGDANSVAVKGDKGERGEDGKPGLVNPDDLARIMPNFAQQFQGAKGEPGERGKEGGCKVCVGFKGSQGLRGQRGVDGTPGSPGSKGDNGEPGVPGRDGIPGAPGMPGDAIKGEKGESGSCGCDAAKSMLSEKGQKGDRGEAGIVEVKDGVKIIRGPPGPPGPPGKSFVGQPGPPGPRGLPGRSAQQQHFNNLGNIIIFNDQDDMTTSSVAIPQGSLAFVLNSQRLFIKVNIGWQSISLGPVLPSVDSDLNNELPEFFEAPNIGKKMGDQAAATGSSKLSGVLKLFALNTPMTPAEIVGISGADNLCYKQANEARVPGIYRAVLTTRLQSIGSLVFYRDREMSVVNSKGEKVLESWSGVTEGKGYWLPRVPIYTFNGTNIHTDNKWKRKYFWHGANSLGEADTNAYCQAWTSSQRGQLGVASSFNEGQLLDHTLHTCDSSLAVLCIETTISDKLKK